MRCCATTTARSPASDPSSPVCHPYSTLEQTTACSAPGREIYRPPSRDASGPQISSPKPEVVSAASIYHRRVDFAEDSLVFEDVPVKVVEDLQRSYMCCRCVLSQICPSRIVIVTNLSQLHSYLLPSNQNTLSQTHDLPPTCPCHLILSQITHTFAAPEIHY